MATITTGTFTNDARKEVTCDGALSIDLIDSGSLCDLLKQYSVGVRTTERAVEDVQVEAHYFLSLEPKS